ncbi:MAG: malonic semialdehyde reductase [Steroidobacteraceae bacterium]|jgi:3-hydroxypropanoate dehydrogenase
MKKPADAATLDLLFREARSYNRWTPDPVPDETLHALYDLLKFGPTAFNMTPARFTFVKSAAAKARLLECVSPGNFVKVQQAPVTVIVGMDAAFPEKLPMLFPAYPTAKDFFKDPVATAVPMLRNASLQGAYLIIAARALGLDCGPMSGFDGAKLDAAFFAGTSVKSNFLCALGTGTTEYLFPRSPRLSFDEACTIA